MVSSVLCVTMVRCWGEFRGVSKGELTMPRNKDLKRLVRARMRKTGEAYTAALAHIKNRKPKLVAVTPPAAARSALRRRSSGPGSRA